MKLYAVMFAAAQALRASRRLCSPRRAVTLGRQRVGASDEERRVREAQAPLIAEQWEYGEEPFDEAQMAKVPTVSYELPDGTTVEMGADRYKLPECHFDPALYQTFAGAPPMPVLKPWAAPKEAAGEDTHMGTVKVCVCENACQPGSLCRACLLYTSPSPRD